MRTTPSGINVKLILSPAFMRRLSRIGLGIVVCPLLVNVASVLMVGSIILHTVSLSGTAGLASLPNSGRACTAISLRAPIWSFGLLIVSMATSSPPRR
jgi:hypothetical protein